MVPLKMWMPQTLKIANFGHPDSKSWLISCHKIYLKLIHSSTWTLGAAVSALLFRSLRASCLVVSSLKIREVDPSAAAA